MKRLPCAAGALLIFTLYLLLTAASAAGRAPEPQPKSTMPESPPAPTFSLATATTATASTASTATTTTTSPTTGRITTTRAAKHKNGMVYLGNYYVTGYDGCYECNGNDLCQTVDGLPLTANRTAAMSKSIPLYTRIYIDGLGEYVVEDRGVGAGVVDVYCPTHAECYAITGHYDVYIVE